MSLAIERGDFTAQVLGVVGMLGMILCVDQLVWRPVVAWAQKFTDEETSSATNSWLWERIRRSRVWREGSQSLRSLRRNIGNPLTGLVTRAETPRSRALSFGRWTTRLLVAATGVGVLFGSVKYVHLLASLNGDDWLHLLGSTAATFLRVSIAVALASLWTVPAGVIIGCNPRLARMFQPIIQMAASFPAPMIFPVVVGGMLALGAGLGVSSVVLLLLGTQWYILFNVIAGTASIPREVGEVSRLARLSLLHRWRKLILPAIFPQLLTGWITAMGGAWNASIVAEYMKYRGQTP